MDGLLEKIDERAEDEIANQFSQTDMYSSVDATRHHQNNNNTSMMTAKKSKHSRRYSRGVLSTGGAEAKSIILSPMKATIGTGTVNPVYS